jgi:hypothetical protein
VVKDLLGVVFGRGGPLRIGYHLFPHLSVSFLGQHREGPCIPM